MGIDEKLNDEELKSLLAEGDTAAFKILFDGHYSQLVFFANKFTGDMQEAEDVVMEVFSKFWIKRASATTIGKLSSFLFSSVRNACVDFLRREARTPLLLQDMGDSFSLEDDIIEGEEVYARLLQQVLDNIEQLPTQCRTIFKLIYFQGKTTKEVGAMLGLSVQSVRNQKVRGLSLLKQQVKPGHLLALVFMQIALFNK